MHQRGLCILYTCLTSSPDILLIISQQKKIKAKSNNTDLHHFQKDIMETTMKCVKYLLFTFNLLFALSGLILIIAGGVIQGIYAEYLDFLGDQFFNTPILLIVVGCITFCVTFFGCCGAIKENHCMTLTFSVLLAVIFVIELGAGIAAYLLKSEVRQIIEVNMEKGLTNYESRGHEGVTKTWNIVQHELECCGAQEYKDWINTTFSGILRISEDQASKIIHVNGCLDKLEHLISSNVEVIGGIGIAIAFLQFIGERVILNAAVLGNPPPTVKWKRAVLKIRRGNGRHRISSKVVQMVLFLLLLKLLALKKRMMIYNISCDLSS
ncbi:CD63 [Lepeophtheirus salmonis]|uniref:CD63 n=1 Tax=Lepeophtheirus salmonis TaxID=72036 RepID=A0A7R8HBU4_LEPSM|nr:CD63 [Lepeophtheirus salmonis]CAF3001200.1 CD63 [Lepeophtheirus salmonis]